MAGAKRLGYQLAVNLEPMDLFVQIFLTPLQRLGQLARSAKEILRLTRLV